MKFSLRSAVHASAAIPTTTSSSLIVTAAAHSPALRSARPTVCGASPLAEPGVYSPSSPEMSTPSKRSSSPKGRSTPSVWPRSSDATPPVLSCPLAVLRRKDNWSRSALPPASSPTSGPSLSHRTTTLLENVRPRPCATGLVFRRTSPSAGTRHPARPTGTTSSAPTRKDERPLTSKRSNPDRPAPGMRAFVLYGPMPGIAGRCPAGPPHHRRLAVQSR